MVIWKDIREIKPVDNQVVLISDGIDISIGKYDAIEEMFDASGFGGYEWDWVFDDKDCFWSEIDFELPLPRKE